MKQLVGLIKWLLKATIFFTLFAFALNNQQDATVHFFFGTQWRGPQVLIVLSAFAAGLMVGALGMAPRWWRRHQAEKAASATRPEVTPSGEQSQRPDAAPHGI